MKKITLCYKTVTLITLTLVYDEPDLEGNELLVIKYNCVKSKTNLCFAVQRIGTKGIRHNMF